jgi:hypothetical protein
MLLRFTFLHSIAGELRGLAARETETETESFASVTGDCAGQFLLLKQNLTVCGAPFWTQICLLEAFS